MAAPSISVHVQKPDGESIEIKLDKEANVSTLKAAISEIAGIPALSQRLVHKTEVMKNDVSLDMLLVEDTMALEVTMIRDPDITRCIGILDLLHEEGLVRPMTAMTDSAVQKEIAIIAHKAGLMEIPTHVANWLEVLLGGGRVPTFLDIEDSLRHPERHVESLIYLGHDNSMVAPIGAECREALIWDNGLGKVRLFRDYDTDEDFTATQWVTGGPDEVQSFSDMTEFFMFKLKQSVDAHQVDADYAELTDSGKRLVIQCRLPLETDESFEIKTFTPEFSPEFAMCTVLDFKDRVSMMTGAEAVKMRVICCGKTLEDDRLLSDYAIEGGKTVHVVVIP